MKKMFHHHGRALQPLALAISCVVLQFCSYCASAPQKKFEPTVESLKAYKCPEWFRDAKFGIYLHWGVYSVAERGEWYARQMYIEGTSEYKHHVERYGHPSKFGYKDFIPMWKAEKFDPDRLVALFKKAGAEYFTPCAVHHDNFDLWDSKHHKWNSVNMGPRKDITGMWREAALKHGLRFGCTTHLARSYSWFQVNKGADKSGPYAGVPYDGANPKYWDFYHDPNEDTNRKHPKNPPEHWRREWALRIMDLIDNYKLDFLYFDGCVPFRGDDNGKTGFEVMAHFYNQSMRWHGGRQECVMTIKNLKDHGIYVDGICTLDMERRRAKELLAEPWQTDTSIGPWGYHAGAKYRSVNEIIDEMVDIVSKNGNMLLNVPPKADGTLDAETERILLDIGKWFDVNGEAIYGTRPWVKYGEGSLRFVRKGDVVYVIALEWPEAGKGLEVSSSALAEKSGKVADVRLLGHKGKLQWEQKDGGLVITVPEKAPCEHAYAFKVVFNR
ncbi:MAG TPA: alpha-L-fucosidase [Sedimentisphaerales bacterium]|nr:alpha-L-fucosidase [Sedimentisphaerales bacterium]